MPAYFDSSVLVAILKNDSQAERGARLWQEHAERVSSRLLEIECLIVLRRLRDADYFSKEGYRTKKERLTRYLEEVSLKNLDSSVSEMIEEEEDLSQCRALDAAHVATALLFARKVQGDRFLFISFDQRMNDVARRVGLQTP